MADFEIKEGDTSPAIKYQLQDEDGNPVDLSGANVRFMMRLGSADTLKIDTSESGAVAVTDAAGGIVEYAWQVDDTDAAGTYQAEWEVTYSDGSVETFPNTEDFIIIGINKDLG